MSDHLLRPLRLLQRIVPGAELRPDSILETAKRNGIPYEFVPIAERVDFDARDAKEQVFDLMFAGKMLPSGGVVVVTDDAFTNEQLLHCPTAELRQMVSGTQQFMFDGDVIFLWCEAAALSVFHHEGGFAHVGW